MSLAPRIILPIKIVKILANNPPIAPDRTDKAVITSVGNFDNSVKKLVIFSTLLIKMICSISFNFKDMFNIANIRINNIDFKCSPPTIRRNHYFFMAWRIFAFITVNYIIINKNSCFHWFFFIPSNFIFKQLPFNWVVKSPKFDTRILIAVYSCIIRHDSLFLTMIISPLLPKHLEGET